MTEPGVQDTGRLVAQLRSELARSQQQVAEMAAAQEEFLRAVAHDLRAPLRHITAYGSLVREALGSLLEDLAHSPSLQEALGFLNTMDHSARRLGLMVDGLQAVSRASRAPLHVQPVPLAQAVTQARTFLGESEAGRVVQWDLAPGLPTLHADPVLLQELLIQLLGNALKFTRGSPQACIRIAAEAEVDGQAAFTVQDNGVGFDPARAGQLFGVFQRLHRETEFEGVGTGLALCRAIAQRHQGAVTATASVHGGCTVRVQWPAS